MHKMVYTTPAIILLAACGGGGGSNEVTVSSAVVQTPFDDGSGVARVVASNGEEAVVLSPNIVNVSAALRDNTTDASDIQISDFAVASQRNGYNIRTGAATIDGVAVNIVTSEEIGNDDIEILYMYTSTDDFLATNTNPVQTYPSGTHTYNGIYGALSRYNNNLFEVGDATVTANFQNESYSISATSTNTSLTGTGFIDTATGRISGSNFTFVDQNNTSHGASVVGNFGESDASKVAGVFHTNDTNPDFGGAFAATR